MIRFLRRYIVKNSLILENSPYFKVVDAILRRLFISKMNIKLEPVLDELLDLSDIYFLLDKSKHADTFKMGKCLRKCTVVSAIVE